MIERAPDEVAEYVAVQQMEATSIRARLTPAMQSRIDMIIRRETEAGVYSAEELRELARLSAGGP